MSVKYKVENAKLNKKLIGDEVTVSKIKPRGPRGPRGPKQPTLRDLIIDIQNDNKSTRQMILSLQKDVKNIQETLKRNNIV